MRMGQEREERGGYEKIGRRMRKRKEPQGREGCGKGSRGGGGNKERQLEEEAGERRG